MRSALPYVSADPTGKSPRDRCAAPGPRQSLPEKIFLFSELQISPIFSAIPSHSKGALGRTSRTRDGDVMDAAASGLTCDGRASLRRLVSDRRQADERRPGPAKPLAETDGRVQPSRVVLAPRRWCQVLRRRGRPNRARTLPSIRKATVARKPDHREEHEAAVKPLRAERRVFWCICKDCARLFDFGRRWLRVQQAPGVPTPSLPGGKDNDGPRARKTRGEIADL